MGDISKTDANIHAGVKYMRFMMDRYYANEPMDKLNKLLMTFASYNAGPARVTQLRRETEKRGSIPTSGSAMSNASRQSGSVAKRSPTSATSSSITSPTA